MDTLTPGALAAWRQEWRLLARSRMALLAILLLGMLATMAVWSGLREVQRQQGSIARVQQMQHDDSARLAAHPARSRDAGAAAYYGFHTTWDPPAPASFLALGLRDTSPFVLRVRALALQTQLHDGDAHNPELALMGRLDFAFVLVYLAPLFVIALLYDLVSGERAAGRLSLLLALPGGHGGLWLRRTGLRVGLLALVLLLPVVAGAWANGLPAGQLALLLVTVLAYLLFWGGLALWVAGRHWPSAANAIALVACWSVLTLVLPSLVQLGIHRAVPAQQGSAMMLAQRDAVHGAWDLPREETLARFFASHPEWRQTAPLPPGFHWKWYFAFQQLGDEQVAGLAAAYRQALLERQHWTTQASAWLPPVAVQTLLHGVAASDLPAQLRHQDAIAAFHQRLRRFFYPYLFTDLQFGPEQLAQAPRFVPAVHPATLPTAALLGLGTAALLLLTAGLRAVRGARPGR